MSFRTVLKIGGTDCTVVSGRGTLTSLGKELRKMGFSGRVAVIADENVPAEIVDTVQSSLQSAKFEPHVHKAPLDEKHKRFDNINKLYKQFSKSGIERRDCVVAIGGGVAGDMVGFAAATWLRGVALVLVPTTLAAMVDASIGGKVGVNLRHSKNTVGAFHPARLVLQDVNTLESLDSRHLLTGLTEAIKHGLIMDEQLLEFMEDNSKKLLQRDPDAIEHIIKRSVELKGDTVIQDAKEQSGQRALLNYGHTVGHALESLAGYGEVSHGEAIAVGMHVAGRIACRLDMLTEAEFERQRAALELYGMPATITGYRPKTILKRAKRDKKVRSDKIVWVLLDAIGNATTRADVADELALKAIATVASTQSLVRVVPLPPRRIRHETEFNYAMGTFLRSYWADTPLADQQAEPLGLMKDAGKRPDIFCPTAERPFGIETAYSKAGAESDARQRLKEKLADGTYPYAILAIWIPDEFGQMHNDVAERELRQGRALRYALFRYGANGGIERFPTDGYLSGTAAEVALLLESIAIPPAQLDELARKVVASVRRAAECVNQGIAGSVQDSIAELMFQHSALEGMQTAAVLWFNAMLVQQHLHQRGAPYPALAETGEDADKCAEAWSAIIEDNWHSIFKPAVSALTKVSADNPSGTQRALQLLCDNARAVLKRGAGGTLHIGAEIFPELSADQKTAAAFYTLPAAAEFLACLTVRPDHLDDDQWSGVDLFARHRLLDLACGTGTLLRAGYCRALHLHRAARVKDLAPVAGEPNPTDALHIAAMEGGVTGADVSGIAAHLSASSLAVLGGAEPYGNTNIGWVRPGAPDRTGSLEFFINPSQSDMLAVLETQGYARLGSSSGKGADNDGQDAHSIVVHDRAYDWVLMNPPYSRTRGGQSAFDIAGLSPKERKDCQRRWGKLTSASKQAGMAASFLMLAERKVKRGGRVGFVLPLTAASASSWQKTRQEFVLKFKDILAVALAGGHVNNAMSADTGMGEMMLVGTRREREDEDGKSAPVTCVTLLEPTHEVGVATTHANAIYSALLGHEGGSGMAQPVFVFTGGTKIGYALALSETGGGAAWSHLGASNPVLSMFTHQLAQGRMRMRSGEESVLPLTMRSVQDVLEMGPGNDLLGKPSGSRSPRGAFVVCPLDAKHVDDAADPMLWAANSDSQKCMLVVPTHEGEVRDEAGAMEMRKQMGTLFIQIGVRWTSQALVAATTAQPMHGGVVWNGLVHHDARITHAAALWLNSIFGILLYWRHGARTQRGRARLSKKSIAPMPFPNLDELSEDVLNTVSAEYWRLRESPMKPARDAAKDPVRQELDQLVGRRMLELDDAAMEDVAHYRALFSREPSVTGKLRISDS